jgi:hypothetical protein
MRLEVKSVTEFRGRAGLPGVDMTKPSTARIYDVLLGGKDNFEVDRAAAQVAIEASPDVPRAARENRAFLGRAVRFAIRAGIRQFIDLGTGLPTQGHVHEVAHALAPDARVVYIDNDPIVLTHARALLPAAETTAVVQADVREPESVLSHPTVRARIDFGLPVAVLMVAVLQFATDTETEKAVSAFREAIVPGSYLIVSHTTTEGHPEVGEQARRAWNDTETKIQSRTRAQVQALFDGFDLIEPGVVWVPQWRPDNPMSARTGTRWMYAGVGRRR